MHHLSRVTAATATLALLAPTIVGSSVAAAVEEDYGSRVTITKGEHVAARLPITLTLPAPADGSAITRVGVSWVEQVPQTGADSRGSTQLDASHCLPEVTCKVEGVLPTALMIGSKPVIRFGVRSNDTTVGAFTRSFTIDNPKPTVAITSPENLTAVWDTFTIAADATPSSEPGAAPLKGVRFYLDTENVYSRQEGYLFDDTPPYAVTVRVDDLEARVLGAPKIAAVAEDVHGRLSTYPESGAYPLITRRVRVGPPPLLAWDPVPPAAGEVGGSVNGGVWLGYHTELHEAVPQPDTWYAPHIAKVERLIDGTVVSSQYLDHVSRSRDATAVFGAADGLTGGRHTFTVRIHTDYRSVSEVSADLLVSDGVGLAGPITSGRRRVRNGFVVTAGDVHRFRVPLETRVAGTYLNHVRIDVGNTWLFHEESFCGDGAVDCAAATVLSNQWGAPDLPGEARLVVSTSATGDRRPTLITRDIVVQPAARLVARVSTHRIRLGRAVRVTGVLRRDDNGAPQAGRTVRIQWLSIGGSRWKTIATRTTNAEGRVVGRFTPRRTGFFRLRSPEVRGTLGPGTSNEPKVRVRRP